VFQDNGMFAKKYKVWYSCTKSFQFLGLIAPRPRALPLDLAPKLSTPIPRKFSPHIGTRVTALQTRDPSKVLLPVCVRLIADDTPRGCRVFTQGCVVFLWAFRLSTSGKQTLRFFLFARGRHFLCII